LLFFLWNFVSLYWSSNTDGTIQRIETYSQIFLLMLIYWDLFQRPEDLLSGLQAFVLGAYVLIVSTVYNYLAGRVAVQYEGRYSATGVNANDVALILLLGLPIAMQLLLARRRDVKGMLLQVINFLYMPLSVFSIVLTGSRTSIIAIIPFVFFVVGTGQIKIRQKILAFIVLFVVSMTLLPLVPQSVIARLGTIGSSIGEADLGGRVNMWRSSIAVLAQHPIFGVGGGAIDQAIGGAVHNTFLSVATETGVIGLALFLSLLGAVFYAVAVLPRRTSALWLAIFVTWVIGVSSLSWEFRKVLWILLSFMVTENSFGQDFTDQEVKLRLPGGVRRSFGAGESASKPNAI
jgi:O-antigen ligase